MLEDEERDISQADCKEEFRFVRLLKKSLSILSKCLDITSSQRKQRLRVFLVITIRMARKGGIDP